MRREAENVISYYSAVRFKERCMKFAYFGIAFVALGFLLVKLDKANNDFWYSFTWTFCIFTVLSVLICIVQDFRMKRMFIRILELNGVNTDRDLFENMQDIKRIHEEVDLYLTKMGMNSFEKAEYRRYKAMRDKYFLDWFMAENDMVYKFRQNPKNEFDEYVIRKHLSELAVLQQKMFNLFINDSEFLQIIDDHFRSLRKDFFNLIVLIR